MIVSPGVYQFNAFAKFVGKTRRIVSVNGQSAAFFWTIDCERSNDNISAGLDGLLHARDVSGAVRRINQKVEGCSIMPNVEGLRRVPFGYVRVDPLYLACPITEPRLGGFERGLRDV